MDNEFQIKRWRADSHSSVPAVVTLSSSGWYGGGTNLWWRIRYKDQDRKIQACVLRDVTLTGNRVYGNTTTASPMDVMFSSKGVHWDSTHEVVARRSGWFLKYQEELVSGGLYAIFTHHGVNITQPIMATNQTEISII